MNQRIKEMELMSKLAETNLRLSNAELTSQQAVVWSELSRAHEMANGMLTPTVCSQNGSSPQSPGDQLTGSHIERSRKERNADNNETSTLSTGKIRSNVDHSAAKIMSGNFQDEDTVELNRITSSDDVAKLKTSNPGKTQPTYFFDSQHRTAMEGSIGSLSDLRLQLEPNLSNKKGGWR